MELIQTLLLTLKKGLIEFLNERVTRFLIRPLILYLIDDAALERMLLCYAVSQPCQKNATLPMRGKSRKPTRGARTFTNHRQLSSSESSSSSSEEEIPKKPIQTQPVIEIGCTTDEPVETTESIETERLNERIEGLDFSNVKMSRKEKELQSKEAAKAKYWQLHAQGKTDQAKADLARLKIIREQREAAAKKRKEEQEQKERERVNRR